MKIKQIEMGEAEALLARVKDSTLNQDDYELIKEFVDTLMLLDQAITEKNSSIKRLLKMIFGYKTEKTQNIKTGQKKKKGKKKVKGHGKNSADDYEGAERIQVPHSTLQHCDPCPACDDGKLYRQLPGVVVRIKGAPPLQATVYEQEKLRCNVCEKIFTAGLPANAGTKKYDETASTMLAVLRYGSGLPLNRIGR